MQGWCCASKSSLFPASFSTLQPEACPLEEPCIYSQVPRSREAWKTPEHALTSSTLAGDETRGHRGCPVSRDGGKTLRAGKGADTEQVSRKEQRKVHEQQGHEQVPQRGGRRREAVHYLCPWGGAADSRTWRQWQVTLSRSVG